MSTHNLCFMENSLKLLTSFEIIIEYLPNEVLFNIVKMCVNFNRNLKIRTFNQDHIVDHCSVKKS